MSTAEQECPHCHALVPVEPSADARFVCASCGGVRVPIDDGSVSPSAQQIEALTTATTARAARATWSTFATVVAAFGVLSALVLWVSVSFAQPPVAGTVAAVLAVLVPFLFAGFSWKRSREQAARLAPALERAWALAARDVARARGGELDASALAKVTRIREPDADWLLARMSAEGTLASPATTEGNLRYKLVDSPEAEPARPLPAAR